MAESPEWAAAREKLDAAVAEYVAFAAAQRGYTGALVLAWAGYAEYTSTELHDEEMSGNVIMRPDGQHAATSRGCFEIGADAFSRIVT